uniref:60S ribosomal protein L4 n=1 Tax=Arundo donax TaxID=35708 RepID=A0A0A9GTM9_ARUDO
MATRRRWTLTRRCQRRQILVGANIRPPRHMLPKAPWPARWVPPPGTRGIRETARPVPQDSAEVWWPARCDTA